MSLCSCALSAFDSRDVKTWEHKFAVLSDICIVDVTWAHTRPAITPTGGCLTESPDRMGKEKSNA